MTILQNGRSQSSQNTLNVHVKDKDCPMKCKSEWINFEKIAYSVPHKKAEVPDLY